MTIVKVLMHNLEQLFHVSREVQIGYLDRLQAEGEPVPDSRADRAAFQHKMQTIEIDEVQFDQLVRLLCDNETHGEVVTKMYTILLSLLEASNCSGLGF